MVGKDYTPPVLITSINIMLMLGEVGIILQILTYHIPCRAIFY